MTVTRAAAARCTARRARMRRWWCAAIAARATGTARAGRATGAFTIRTTSMTRALAVQPTGGALPYVAVRLAADDRLLDAMIFSRGRFTIEQPGTAPTVLPPWAELARVVEDCRG